MEFASDSSDDEDEDGEDGSPLKQSAFLGKIREEGGENETREISSNQAFPSSGFLHHARL